MNKNKQINIYKFRAECQIDVIRFLNKHSNTFSKIIIIKDKRSNDCEVEIESSLKYSEIINIMRQIPDSHIMIQTLNSKLKYTGIRNYEII